MQEARLSKPLKLPEQRPSTWRPVEHLLARRRSVREFDNEPLSLGKLGRLLAHSRAPNPYSSHTGADCPGTAGSGRCRGPA
jgi:hypothetical protein